MKKLNYVLTVFWVSLIAVNVCLPVINELSDVSVVPAPKSPLTPLQRFASMFSFGRKSPVTPEVSTTPFSTESCTSNSSFGTPEKSVSTVVTPCSPLQALMYSTMIQRDPLLPWQRRLVNQVKKELPGFTCTTLGDGSMEIVGAFMVGTKTWRVYDSSEAKPCVAGDEKASWAPVIIVTPTANPGIYEIDIKTPDLLYFEHVHSVKRRMEKINSKGVRYVVYVPVVMMPAGCWLEKKRVDNLESFFRSSSVKVLHPKSAVYSE